jgi:hypothetical protein
MRKSAFDIEETRRIRIRDLYLHISGTKERRLINRPYIRNRRSKARVTKAINRERFRSLVLPSGTCRLLAVELTSDS